MKDRVDRPWQIDRYHPPRDTILPREPTPPDVGKASIPLLRKEKNSKKTQSKRIRPFRRILYTTLTLLHLHAPEYGRGIAWEPVLHALARGHLLACPCIKATPQLTPRRAPPALLAPRQTPGTFERGGCTSIPQEELRRVCGNGEKRLRAKRNAIDYLDEFVTHQAKTPTGQSVPLLYPDEK